MEQVFAPWRIEWVKRPHDDPDVDECVFCELPTLGDDRGYHLVARSDHAYVLLNNYPYNPGHAMVIPYEHTGAYEKLDPEVLFDHARLQQRTVEAIETALDPDGLNVGMNLGGSAAGGSIDDHLHTHVVPRWDGDASFMTVIAETKVIVEAIEDTYDRLHEAFAAQEGATVPAEGGAVEIETTSKPI
ncbi:HIT family protein [Halapricum hydrolyticum]|uniref:HIT domain-containing protein n=1 Tax=Halapricum hydrolyticum TaxID=2979991 RepID=A0AAE3LEA8_9EURY|nr:HIT domain-containing protein [Halapricum hydrolyticum]MCU4717195.1 HIT domain-containing protein [Halapricum hydrolyticum]MCU4726122.1 HIT domain-containing protein [Halapricum hydrolyticum]